jgi:cobalt-zinc-cadmium efflux system protein
VAAIGLVINGLSAWLFARDSAHDINVRGAFLHLLADAGVSLAVVVGGLVMRQTGWFVVDPLLSLVIVAVILWGTWGLLRESLELALSAVPRHVDMDGVRAYLAAQPGVQEVHDLHIWAISTTQTALTAHVVVPGGAPDDAVVDAWVADLRERFAIHHATLQVERGSTDHACHLAGGAHR